MNKKAIYALTAIALQSVIFQSANAESTVRITSNITAIISTGTVQHKKPEHRQ